MRPIVGRFMAVATVTVANGATGNALFDKRVPAGADLIVKSWSGEKSAVNAPLVATILTDLRQWNLHAEGFTAYDDVEVGADYPAIAEGLEIGAGSELRLQVANTSGVQQTVWARIHGYLTPRGVFTARQTGETLTA